MFSRPRVGIRLSAAGATARLMTSCATVSRRPDDCPWSRLLAGAAALAGAAMRLAAGGAGNRSARRPGRSAGWTLAHEPAPGRAPTFATRWSRRDRQPGRPRSGRFGYRLHILLRIQGEDRQDALRLPGWGSNERLNAGCPSVQASATMRRTTKPVPTRRSTGQSSRTCSPRAWTGATAWRNGACNVGLERQRVPAVTLLPDPRGPVDHRQRRVSELARPSARRRTGSRPTPQPSHLRAALVGSAPTGRNLFGPRSPQGVSNRPRARVPAPTGKGLSDVGDR